MLRLLLPRTFLQLFFPHRARAKLQQEAREQIDATLTKLVPAFDLRSTEQQPQQQQQQDAGKEAAAAAAAAEDLDGPMQEALEQLYLPVTALCSKGRYKASHLQQQVAEAAAEAAQADAAAAAAATVAPAAQGTSSAADQQAGMSAAGADEADAGTEQQPEEEQQGSSGGSGGGAGSSQLEQLLQRLLSGLRSAAVKSLAEVAAGQLMLLLSLGRSVAAVPRWAWALGPFVTCSLNAPACPPSVIACLLSLLLLAL